MGSHVRAVMILVCLGACAGQPASEPPTVSSRAEEASSGSPAGVDVATERQDAVVSSVAEAARWVPEVEGYGRVLDPTPFVLAATNLDAARSAADTAERELHRVEELQHEAQNASVRQVETARAAAARARADREMAGAQLAATFGPALAGDPRLPEMARRLALREVALIRIDVPGAGSAPRPERGARLVAFPRSDGDLVAEFLGAAADRNPSLPGWSYLFLVAEASPPVGTPIRAMLHGAGEPSAGVSIPATALVRHGDGVFVFVQRKPGVFERRTVETRPQADGKVFVAAGLVPGETIVTAGAQSLLSADLLDRTSGHAPTAD